MKKKILIIISCIILLTIVFFCKMHYFRQDAPKAANGTIAQNQEATWRSKVDVLSATSTNGIQSLNNKNEGYALPDYVATGLFLDEKEASDMRAIFNGLRIKSLKAVAQYATCEYSENSTIGIMMATPQATVDALSEDALQAIEKYLGKERYEKNITNEMKDVILDSILYYARRNGTLIVSIDGATLDQIHLIKLDQNLKLENGKANGSFMAFTQNPTQQFQNTFGAIADLVFCNWKPLKN